MLPHEWKEEHLPIRVITDCKSLFDCLAKDASVPEDRGTALKGASLRERCSAGVGRDQKRSGLMWTPKGVQLADGLTKSSAGIFLRSAMISGTGLLHEESTQVLRRKQTTDSSKEVQVSLRSDPDSKVRGAITDDVQIGPTLDVVSFESRGHCVVEILVPSMSPSHEESWVRRCRSATQCASEKVPGGDPQPNDVKTEPSSPRFLMAVSNYLRGHPEGSRHQEQPQVQQHIESTSDMHQQPEAAVEILH